MLSQNQEGKETKGGPKGSERHARTYNLGRSPLPGYVLFSGTFVFVFVFLFLFLFLRGGTVEYLCTPGALPFEVFQPLRDEANYDSSYNLTNGPALRPSFAPFPTTTFLNLPHRQSKESYRAVRGSR